MSAIPVITRPVRGGHISLGNDGAQTPPAFLGGPFSPVGLVQPSSVKTPSSMVQLVPRAPVVHFFVCDFANAKVKTFSEQFIEQLTQNGVKVYTERFMTHQPGFQVRAASLNTPADFFFQIHSKTAGRGDVRRYLNGQPRRMTREEGVAEVWAWWRLKSGALSREEVDVVSGEKMAWLLKEFADVDCEAMALDELQKSLRDAIEMRTEIRSVLDRLREIEGALVNGKMKVASMRKVFALLLLPLTLCGIAQAEVRPSIRLRPDVAGVTVPPNICPLNFDVEGASETARVTLSNGKLERDFGKNVRVPERFWRELLQAPAYTITIHDEA